MIRVLTLESIVQLHLCVCLSDNCHKGIDIGVY